MGVLSFGFFPPAGISVPVHSHLTDLPILRLTENRPSRINLFAGPPPPERAPKLRREPRPRRVDLARRERSLGLMQRDILPVRSDRRLPAVRLAERRLDEHRIVGEDRDDRLDVAALPALPETVDQRPVALFHARKYTRPMRLIALLIGLACTACAACQPLADDGYTLLFLGRSSAARVGRISWAPDAPRSRLVAFDGR